MVLDRIITTGLASLILIVQTVPAYAQPLSFEPVEFDSAVMTYTTTATGGSAVMTLRNSMGDENFEIAMPARFEAKATKGRPE